MKLKLNFKADEPTLNGHVYPKEVLKKAFDDRLKSSLFITEKFDGDATRTPVSDIIGQVTEYEINENNEILIGVKALRYKELFEDEDIKLTTVGYGTLDEDEKIIKEDFILTSLFLTKEGT